MTKYDIGMLLKFDYCFTIISYDDIVFYLLFECYL